MHPKSHLQTKSAFTRQYNKSGHKLHYGTNQAPTKRRVAATAALDEAGDEGEESEVDSDEEIIKALKVVSATPVILNSEEKESPKLNLYGQNVRGDNFLFTDLPAFFIKNTASLIKTYLISYHFRCPRKKHKQGRRQQPQNPRPQQNPPS